MKGILLLLLASVCFNSVCHGSRSLSLKLPEKQISCPLSLINPKECSTSDQEPLAVEVEDDIPSPQPDSRSSSPECDLEFAAALIAALRNENTATPPASVSSPVSMFKVRIHDLSQSTFEARLSPNTANLLVLSKGGFTEQRFNTIRSSPLPFTASPRKSLAIERLKRQAVTAIKDGNTGAFKHASAQANSDFFNSLFADEDTSSSLLHLCIKYENYEIFTELLENRVSPNLADASGRDVLTFALEQRQAFFLQVLLSYAPIVEARHIFYTIQLGFIDGLNQFIDAGIDIKSLCGQEALNLALESENAEIIEILTNLEITH